MVRWIAILLLVAGCAKKPDPNAVLKRELLGLCIRITNGLTYPDFREARQRIETELALRGPELSIKAHSYGTSLRLDFERINYFWKQHVNGPYPRTATETDRALMLGLAEVDRYVPSDLVKIGLTQAAKDARKLQEGLSDKRVP